MKIQLTCSECESKANKYTLFKLPTMPPTYLRKPFEICARFYEHTENSFDQIMSGLDYLKGKLYMLFHTLINLNEIDPNEVKWYDFANAIDNGCTCLSYGKK